MAVPIQSEAHSRYVGRDSVPTIRENARTVFYISEQTILSCRRSGAAWMPELRQYVY